MNTGNADQLRLAVKSLSKLNADEVAALIQTMKIKGRTGTTYRCPLALLLSSTYGGQFVVGRKFIARQSGNHTDKLPTPNNMRAFVKKFDSAGYPELIAPAPRCVAKPARKRKASDDSERSHGGSRGVSVRRSKRVIKHRIAHEVGRFD